MAFDKFAHATVLTGFEDGKGRAEEGEKRGVIYSSLVTKK